MSTTMLLNAELGEEFCEKARTYAVNIFNCIPSYKPKKKGKRMSSYEQLWRERPILSDLKPFGCRGAAWIPVSDGNHLGKGQYMIYMGKDFKTR